MQPVDIYCRTATQEQGLPIALEVQERACRAYCEQHGLTVGLVIQEIAPGTTYKDRTGLGLIRARYQNHAISGIVVTHLDRLTRIPDYLFELLEEFEWYGATLHCASEDLNSNLLVRFFKMGR